MAGKSDWAQRLRLIAHSNIASPCYRMQLGPVGFGKDARYQPAAPLLMGDIDPEPRVYTQNSGVLRRDHAR